MTLVPQNVYIDKLDNMVHEKTTHIIEQLK